MGTILCAKGKHGKVKIELYYRSMYQILVLSGMCSLFSQLYLYIFNQDFFMPIYRPISYVQIRKWLM
jgi:hypothetical protein